MKAGFEAVKKYGTLSLSLISGILIIIFTITGCSDVPYTGPTLSVEYVDQYLDAIGEDTVCLQDGFDTVCIKLLPRDDTADDTADDDTAVVHVHPTNVTYIFHYEGKRILRAEREMDTAQIVQELIDVGRVQLPQNTANHGVGTNAVGNWTIQIYYPDLFPETNRGSTPETSGLDIRVVEGMQIGTDNGNDLQITNFTQTDDADGSRSVLFSIETSASKITIQVNNLVPYHTALFYINADDVASGGGSNILELEPL